MKNEKNNKKKVLLVLLGISIVTVLGSTIAYFTTTTDIANLFKTALYQAEVKEEFISPENWTPGQTTSKNVNVTNTGSIPMSLRASYTEKWISKSGKELSLKDSNGNVVSIINFNSDWNKDSDGFYYYGTKDNMTKLDPNETSTSFISGVTFNSNVISSLKETKSADGKTISYTSNGDGYDDATYTLTIKIDTIDYSQKSIWK
jgi:hypothetical protein